MRGFAESLTVPSAFSFSSIKSRPQLNSAALVCRIGHGHIIMFADYRKEYHYRSLDKKYGKGNYRNSHIRATRRESPYEVLGVSPAASTKDIKRAYRRLALKYHPDVYKEADAPEKFMRIKHAYNSLLNSKSRGTYNAGSQDFSNSTTQRYQSNTKEADEEFYGFGDFFRDLQEEFRNWEETAAAQGKPKSLWEELAEIGEEFVEFLEKELNVSDTVEVNDGPYRTKKTVNSDQNEADKGGTGSINDNIDEIEATLAQLKKELGL